MKKLISLISVICLLFVTISVKSQISLGIKAGFNFANMNVINSPLATDNKSVPSINFGVFVSKKIINKLEVETGLYLTGKGIDAQFNQSILIYTISGYLKTAPLYLEIPVNLKYNLDFKKFKVFAFTGPYIAYGVGGKYKTNFSATGLPVDLNSLGLVNEDRNLVYGSDSTSDLKHFDYGLDFGIGAQFKKFIFTIQYDLGLVNIVAPNTTGYEAKNKVFVFSVGYKIF